MMSGFDWAPKVPISRAALRDDCKEWNSRPQQVF